MMSILSFDDFQTQIQAHYRQKEYAQALELAMQNASRFPDKKPILLYWQISMAARLGDVGLSLQLLSGALATGFWYSETLLRKSPSLQILQGNPDFERVVEQNRAQQLQDQEQIFPLLVLHQEGDCQGIERACPLLLALHANSSTAQASVDFWKPAASAGWLVAVPQSSQAMWKDAYMWDDVEITLEEIQRHYASLERQYTLDAAHLTIAGHSMGGEVAIQLALSGAIDAIGLIAIGPGGPFMDAPESWTELIEQAKDRLSTSGFHWLRCYIIFGEEDQTISLDNIQALAEKMIQAGFECRLEPIAGAGHEYHPAYAPALLRGLDFIREDR